VRKLSPLKLDNDADHPKIAALLRSKTILLRLNFGSQEAGYLSAFCPLSQAPTLVIIEYVVWMVLRLSSPIAKTILVTDNCESTW